MLTFQIPLERKPRLQLAGRAVHGRVPVERYHLRKLWCLHLYSYHASLSINGVDLDIKPGDLGIVPADALLCYRYQGRSEHLFAHFELFSPGKTWSVPALRASGSDFPHLYRLFEEAVGLFSTELLHAEVRLWDLLWTATQNQGGQTKGKIHTAVTETMRQIELRLHEPLLVETLAREVGLSHNHLTRLFRAAMSQTVKGYLSQRRMAKAKHLLQKSSTAIKSIAYEVGIQNLHAFNKAVHRHFGCSPRELRSGVRRARN